MSIILIRTTILYLIIVAAIRIMGKRQLGELQPSELVVTIMVSNIATLSIEDTNIPLLGSLLPIFMLVTCEVVMSVITLKSKAIRKVVSGNPRIIIKDGTVSQKEMRSLRWSIDDLMEQLRDKNIFDPSEVSFAVVETAGTLSIYQKFDARPATAKMLCIPPDGEPDAPPLIVISDGELDKDSLKFCNLTEAWLEKVLAEKELAVKDVFLMSCNRRAEYHITRKEGKKQ